MKRFAFGWLLVLAFLAGVSVKAEDAAKPDDKKAGDAKADDKKADDKKAGDTKAPDVKANEESKTGTLAEKPTTAAADVVAVLKIQADAAGAGGGKKGKHGDDAGGGKKKGKHGGDAADATEKTINLSATGDVATKLADLAKRTAYVQVSGVLTGDTMKVSSVFETERTVPGEKKGGKGKKNK
ncbi:MAG TPA: hypothetical protein VGP72_04140 [Planctomycetota bacterium]|jgi:nitric oxide reductase activation protein